MRKTFLLAWLFLVAAPPAFASDQLSTQSALSPGQIAFLDGPPAANDQIIFGVEWFSPVSHSEAAPVDCKSPEASSSSQCVATIKLNAPHGATHAILKIKAKAWVTNARDTSGPNYALIYASAPMAGYLSNHFVHTETFGRGPDGQGENRRVVFTNIVVPITYQTIRFQIGKEISGKSSVEFIAYLAGYYANPSPQVAIETQSGQ